MTTSVTGYFAINSTVYHVSLQDGVREGVVRSLTVKINATATTIKYDVGYTLPSLGTSSVEADEVDLFAVLDDALAEYKTRILA